MTKASALLLLTYMCVQTKEMDAMLVDGQDALPYNGRLCGRILSK